MTEKKKGFLDSIFSREPKDNRPEGFFKSLFSDGFMSDGASIFKEKNFNNIK